MELQPDYPVRGARLALRPLVAADTADLIAYRSLEAVCRFVPIESMDAGAIAARLDAGWSRQAIRTEGDALTLGVELAATGRVIGDLAASRRAPRHAPGGLPRPQRVVQGRLE